MIDFFVRILEFSLIDQTHIKIGPTGVCENMKQTVSNPRINQH